MKFDTLDKFLNYGIFTIPEYQRGYSWTKEQLEDFTNDLDDVEFVKEHYAGTVTLIKSGQESVGISQFIKYDVVDGQQRITTIHLLLISLYFRLKEINSSDDIIIKNVFYKGKTFLRLNNKENHEFFHYLLNEEDISTLRKAIPVSKTQKNLISARIYFYNYFQRFSSQTRLVKIYNNLMTKFKINVFELEEESEVGLIFETMNDRGLPLSDIDKVKNYLIYMSHKLDDKQLAREINKKFGELFSELMTIEYSSITKIENSFLKDCYLIYCGDTKELNDIHKKIKSQLIKQREIFKNKSLFDNNVILKNKKLNEIKDFNNFLHKCSALYAKIYNQNFENEELNNSLFRLKSLGRLETFLPLILAVSINKKYRNEFLIPILELLEIYTIRVYVFGNKKSKTGITSFYDLAYKIYSNKLIFNDLKKEIRNLIQKNSTTTELRRNIVNLSIYNNKDNNIIKFFLFEYEKHLQYEAKTYYEFGNLSFVLEKSKISIEHISPQIVQPGVKPLKNINNIGNLVLTFGNSTLSNKNFLSKKEYYKNSDLLSEKELLLFEKWDDKEVSERGKKLSKFIIDKWKV
ncbi:MAG: DUF262 domain-containing HNH endonuclease family protein [Bacteroidota bacterium]